jgi:predicted ribosome quality control (RQC) complex YloA/Tae2 family protein
MFDGRRSDRGRRPGKPLHGSPNLSAAPRWDAVLVGALAGELERRLRGARLRALYLDPGGRSALLFLREGTLAVRFRPEEAGVTLLDPSEPLPFARAYPATLEAVDAPPDDRLLLLRFRKARGRGASWLLALELLPNRWNAVWADGEGERIRHVLARREGDRPLRPGLPYAPPAASTREGADRNLPAERWMEILEPRAPRDRRAALLSSIAWTSPLNADALLGDAAHTEGQRARESLADGYRLWTRLHAAVASAEPTLLTTPDGLQPYPLALPGVPAEPAAGLLEAFASATSARGREGRELLPSEWLAALQAHVSRLQARVERLERELAEAPDPDGIRAVGDLLLARFAEVPKGASRVTLADFAGEPVEVRLDPKLGPQQNAARYYERAGRAARARERLPGLLTEARESAGRASSLLAKARSGQAGLGEVQAALPATADAAASEDPRPALPYRVYRSSGGLEIRVGRGAQRNDELTFHHSSPQDVWLHARHAAGAHVVLRWSEDGNPPARDLAEAATLAALHSRARGSGSVPVDWTRRKYVRKPRKAPPGTVVLERAQTVFVRPDAAVEERLKVER